MGLTRTIGKDKAISVISSYRPCKPPSFGIQIVYEKYTRTLIDLIKLYLKGIFRKVQ